MCVQASAHEGRSALVLSEELKPDVLVLDGNPPNGDGLEMTTALTKPLLALRQNVLCKLQVLSRVELIGFVRHHQPLPSPLGVMS